MWGRKRRQSELQAVQSTLAQALEGGFARLLEAQAKMVETNGHFLAEMGQIQVRQAARALGARGGARTAAKKAATKKAAACPLCQDPMRQDVTVEMISFHRQHGSTAPNTAQPNGPVQ